MCTDVLLARAASREGDYSRADCKVCGANFWRETQCAGTRSPVAQWGSGHCLSSRTDFEGQCEKCIVFSWISSSSTVTMTQLAGGWGRGYGRGLSTIGQTQWQTLMRRCELLRCFWYAAGTSCWDAAGKKIEFLPGWITQAVECALKMQDSFFWSNAHRLRGWKRGPSKDLSPKKTWKEAHSL